MIVTQHEVNQYVSSLLTSPFPAMAEMEKFAAAQDFPIIGPMAARVLQHYAALLNAKDIFECGSGFGYSALWFASGMKDGGRIVCTDLADKNLQKARLHFKEQKLNIQLDTRSGNAVEILRSYREQFDIIFMDVDKHQYVDCFDVAWPRVRKGGALIADNILWHGKVLKDSTNDAATEAVKLFTRIALKQKDAITTILPIDDGLLIAVKK